MPRDTKRLYSVGRAQDPDTDPGSEPDDGPAAEAAQAPPQGEPDHTVVMKGVHADAASSEVVRPVIEVGDGSDALDSTQKLDEALPQDDGDGAPRQAVELPRQEKPLPLTRSRLEADAIDPCTPQLQDRAGRGATVRMAPSSEPPGDGAEDAPSAGGLRRCPTCQSQFSSTEVRFCPFDGQPLVEVANWDPTGDPLVGKTVSDRYQVESVLAEGSMGTVYQVLHTKLGTPFAMKVLRRDLAREEQIASRIIDEARATAAIGHPNIVAVTDFGEIDGDLLPDLGDLRLPFFVMELLVGGSLGDAVREAGSMPAERIAGIAQQCAAALGAAHGAGIIHRDLKPENIRLTRSELGAEVVKVVDFGVAKIIGRSRKTQAGVVFGTPHYMSPEQGKGMPIDHRTDVYALGIIMYECLMGKVPFEADTYMGVVTKHLFTRPEPLQISPGDPFAAALEPVVMRCLSKDPEERFGTMGELAEELERLLAGVPAATAGDFWRPPRLELRDRDPSGPTDGGPLPMPAGLPTRSPLWVFAVAAAVLVVGLLGILALRQLRDSGAAAGHGGAGGTPESAGEARASSEAAPASSATAGSGGTTGATLSDEGGGGQQGRDRPTPSSAPEQPAAPTSAAPRTPGPRGPKPKGAATSGGEVVDPWSD